MMAEKKYEAFINDYVISGSQRIGPDGQTVWETIAYSASFARDYGLNYVVKITVFEKEDDDGITLHSNESKTALTDAVLQAVQQWMDESSEEE